MSSLLFVAAGAFLSSVQSEETSEFMGGISMGDQTSFTDIRHIENFFLKGEAHLVIAALG